MASRKRIGICKGYPFDFTLFFLFFLLLISLPPTDGDLLNIIFRIHARSGDEF